MEFSKGNRRDVDRSNLTPENSSIETSNGLNDNHQLLTVSDKDKNYSDFIDDKKRVCSNIECKTFLGEAIRNRKLSKDYQIEKTQSTPENETSDEYLQDSYNYVFQRHVDHLTTVISQHMNSTQPATSDKTKTQVHIRPTENFAKNDNSDVKISRKPSPKSKKKILTKLEIKAAAVETTEPKTVKFAEEEISSEGEMRVIKEKLEEANIFEELNNNETSDRKPMIVFNHVSTETKPEKISYQVINKAGSRSPSPLLEVPSLEFKAEPMRPPL